MSQRISPESVVQVFKEAEACANAENCKKAAEAMCLFYALDNQHTLASGDGLITFYSAPEGPCPNEDQLFCHYNSDTA